MLEDDSLLVLKPFYTLIQGLMDVFVIPKMRKEAARRLGRITVDVTPLLNTSEGWIFQSFLDKS